MSEDSGLFIVTFKPDVLTEAEVIHWLSAGVSPPRPIPMTLDHIRRRQPELFERPGRYALWRWEDGINVEQPQ